VTSSLRRFDDDFVVVISGPHEIGARNVEGPEWLTPGYYAVFFEDPFGNRLEGDLPNGNLT